jgi:hypothetical protein
MPLLVPYFGLDHAVMCDEFAPKASQQVLCLRWFESKFKSTPLAIYVIRDLPASPMFECQT